MAKAQQAAVADVITKEGPVILDELVKSFKPTDKAEDERARDLLGNLVQELLDPGAVRDKRVTKTINARIAAIDELLSAQVDAILHHAEFQKLEGTWRSLHKLVMGTETGENMQIRVLNVKKEELLNDFDSASEFTESALWKGIYEYEYGLYGGDPYGCLIGDYEFGKSVQDVALLSHLSEVAAAAHAPFVAASAPQMFGMERFTDLPDPRDLAKIFDKNNPQNTKWISFRNKEESRYVALCLPHVLRRLPYGRETTPVDAFDYEEKIDGEHDNYLWGNAAFEFAGRLTAAFAKYHWCVAIRGPEGGGLVEGLPIHVFKDREGDVSSKCPTEALIPDTREQELSDLGFIPLVHCKNTDYAAFFGGNAVRRPKKYDRPDATANDELSCRIPYMMAVSRIAHYLKSICRDKIGAFMSRTECENFLNRWIANYVLAMDEASQDAKAEKPLRDARVVVEDDPARPGCYRAVAHLRPHFQLEKLNVSLRLVAELPTPVK
jgi:type VI secretion system protein ImpC